MRLLPRFLSQKHCENIVKNAEKSSVGSTERLTTLVEASGPEDGQNYENTISDLRITERLNVGNQQDKLNALVAQLFQSNLKF